ncbi:MAG: prolipoprotein diacylglyceryl transferase [Ruminococcaceae bacterium]|nr:prolipoprotein diacylglyceryl transferase [Oscillospiraceae bacterium]
MVTISFPGLGIDNFKVNPVAIDLGKIEIRWYALIITLGMILAAVYCIFRAKQEGISMDNLFDMVLFGILFGIVGARTYYVLMKLDTYDSFLEMIAIWKGGLAIYGGIIGGALTILVICKIRKINPFKALDMAAPAVMIGQILGRWGNFFNGEAYGTKVAADSILYPLRMGLLPNIDSYSVMYYYHPTFFYESLWNLVGFILINLVYKKKKFDGQIFYMYISWYGFGRMFIEGLRTDSLYIGEFRVSQVVAFICVIVGVIMLIYNLLRERRRRMTAESYEPVYPKFSHFSSASTSEDAVSESETVNETEELPEEDVAEEEQEEKRYTIRRSPYSVDEDKVKELFDDKKEDEEEK